MSQRVAVRTTSWKLGWELELDEDHHTQVRTLPQAVQQVHDYLDTMEPDVNHDDWEIDIQLDIGPVIDQVKAAKAASAAAAAATREAAQLMREAVWQLRHQGLSVTDIAWILGVSRGRVSQLVLSQPRTGRAGGTNVLKPT